MAATDEDRPEPAGTDGTSGSAGRKRLLQSVLVRLRPLRAFPVWARYAIATVVLAGFTALRETVPGDLSGHPYVVLFPAIILVSFAFDRGTGFYTTILAAALTATRATVHGVGSGLALVIFVLVGLFCASVIEALRLTIEELGDREAALERDIEERKRAEAALADSEARFRAAFDFAAAGMAIVGLDGRWLRVNQRLCEKLGYSEAELLARTFQDITFPDDLDADLDYVRRLLAGEIPVYSMEKRYVRKDGSLLWILLTVALVRDVSGVPQYFISVIQDLSQRKAAEQVLARDREELGKLVEARTAALMRESEDRRRAEDALRQGEKLQAIGQLTGGIAHDFNNFLQVVSAGAQLLMRAHQTPERQQAILDGMVKATRNAADLTSRLLAFARKQALRPESFDLNERLLGIRNMLEHTLNSRIELRLDLGADPSRVHVDPNQLDVALVNLAVNARDAMPEGGTLTLMTRHSAAGPDGAGHIDLTMRDSGEGMSPEVLARVFEPFFTTKAPDRGTGLGLAQVHGFVKQSGGDVIVESAVGKGTSVTLRLPRGEASGSVAGPAALVERPVRGVGRCVLVVDDNADVAALASAMLGELGYSARRAESPAEALELLANGKKIDVVFSDIVMRGGVGGLDLARAVRERHPGVAVVLATGYSDALAALPGPLPWEVLSKPYGMEALGAALDRALGG